MDGLFDIIGNYSSDGIMYFELWDTVTWTEWYINIL